VLLALSVFADAESDFECVSIGPTASQIELKFSAEEYLTGLNSIGVEVKLNSEIGASPSVSTKQSFGVEKAENEILWESVNRGQDYWIVNEKNGSSVRKRQVGASLNTYQFYLQNPSAEAERLIIDLSTSSPVGGGSKVAGAAEVFVHKKDARHATYLGRVQVECRPN